MKKQILIAVLLCSLVLTGCDKFERIMDILQEKETEVVETEVPVQNNIPEETEPAAKPSVPEIPAKPEITEPDETPVQPEVPETPPVPENLEQPEDGVTILSDNEALTGHWECAFTDADGREVMLYLSMSEDGMISYSYGCGNSEIAEIFGGYWGIADVYLALEMTGGVQDMELGYVPEPYEFDSLYSYEWVEPGKTLTLRLNSGTALLFGSEESELTFRCTGTLDNETFDPFRGVKPKEMDSTLVIGDWYSTYWHPDGYELAMHLTVSEDGTASYRYGLAYGEIYEAFEGTWISDAAGNFSLYMHGGWLNGEESEYYDFEGQFRWDVYDDHLSLIHEGGNPLIGGCEEWFFEFLPFDFTLYDGEWVTFDENRQYNLHLLTSGDAYYVIWEGETTVSTYEGEWYIRNDSELELSVKRTDGEGADTIDCTYDFDWTEFPYTLNIRLRDSGFALTDAMAASGEDSFHWIDPNAVG